MFRNRPAKKFIAAILILGMAVATTFSVSCREPGQEERMVEEIDWDSIDLSVLDSADYSDADDLIEVIQLNTKYLLNTWWTEERVAAFSGSNRNDLQELTQEQQEEVTKSRESFFNWESEDYLYLVNAKANDYSENAIRPLSHACMTLAVAIRFGLYDEDVTGVSYEDAAAMTAKLIASVAKMHLTNTEDGWGGQWQSALWAEETGFAAWLLYSELDVEAQEYVVNMVISEADARSVGYEVPYYRDADGEVVYEGDSKAEENAWNSRILALASCMLPNHPNNEIWMDKLYELLLSSTARPSDVGSSEVVDGLVLGDILNGSNINEDGTVVNHNRYHIDYMVSEFDGMTETAILFALAGRDVPESALFNLDVIYDALVNLDIGIYDETKAGHHFYERDSEENASYVTNMPDENDWGSSRVSNYYFADTVAAIWELDGSCPENLKGEDWAAARIERLKEMVSRGTDGEITGQIYQDGEEIFASGETFAMSLNASTYLLRVLDARGMF